MNWLCYYLLSVPNASFCWNENKYQWAGHQQKLEAALQHYRSINLASGKCSLHQIHQAGQLWFWIIRELLVPFITLQLSLVKATTFVQEMSNFLQCRVYLIECYRKKIEKIKPWTSIMNINYFFSHYLKVPSRTSQMASPVPTLHTGMSRKRVIAQCCISKYLTSTRHLSHP